MHVRAPLAILVCALGILSLPAISRAQDPGLADTIRIDSVAAFTNAIASVPIYFVNDEPLGGIEITLQLSSPDIQIDSFSFNGGRLQFYAVKGVFSPPNGYSIYCLTFSGEPLIPAGSGLAGRLYLSWDIGISPQLAAIDTITVVNADVLYSTRFSTAEAVSFEPKIKRGYIDIAQGFGCCIGIRGNVDGDDLESVNVGDVTALVNYLFKGGAPPDCREEADVDGDPNGSVNVGDLTYLLNYLFRGGPPAGPCQ